jgi:hypothetical protein
MLEQLRELEAEVQHLQVSPAAAVRARGRRRARRQLSVTLVAGAVVATTVGVAVTRSPEQPLQSAAAPEIACVVSMPKSPTAVRIRVLDGGAPAGLAATTVARLRERSFTVQTGAAATAVHNPATLHYGPAAIGAAAFLKVQLLGDPSMVFDPGRADDTIDLTIGPSFAARFASPTELNRALVTAGQPSAPPQCTSVVEID